MAIKKSIEIDVNARDAIKQMNELGGTFEDVFGEAVPLNTQLGEMEDVLYAMARAGDTTSKEFRELSAQVGEMKKVIIETDMVVDGLSQTMAQNVGGALQGVASGFELAQGAMGAFGAGGEAVEEALLKVQSAMAMAQGLQGIRESISSFKALRKSIMSATIVQQFFNFVMNLNPIGLIIAGVVALGAAIALLWSPIKKLAQFFGLIEEEAETAAEANKKLTATMEAQDKVMDRLMEKSQKRFDNEMRLLKLKENAEQETHDKTLERLAEEEAQRNISLVTSKGRLNQLQAQYKAAKKEEDDETARSIKDQIGQEKDKITKLKLLANEYTIAKKEEETNYNKWKSEEDQKAIDDEKDKLKERNDNYKNFLQARLEARRRIEDLETDLILDSEQQAITRRRLSFEREIEDLKGNEAEKARQKELLTIQYDQELRELKLSFIDEDIELKTLETEISKEALDRQMSDFVENEQAKRDAAQETADRNKQLAQEEADAKYEIAKQGLQLISDVAGLFAGKSERAAKLAFNVQKAASIASATMDGYRAVLSTYAQTPGGPIIKGVAAGIAGGFAGLQIANIASTEFQGGGTPNLSSSPPSIGSLGGGDNVANFNVVGNTGVNQLAESLGNKESQPIKAYVVGKDVTTQQGLDRDAVNTATL